MNGQSSNLWRRCSFCKKEISFSAKYYVCSVSTCRQKRTGLVFCSSSCWDGHDGESRHRESWAEEAIAPTRSTWLAELASAAQSVAPRESRTAQPRSSRTTTPSVILRKSSQNLDTAPASHATPSTPAKSNLPKDILIVASKLKAYIKARSGMSTSDACFEPLSDELRNLSERGIESARRKDRKTVLDRDFNVTVPPVADPTLPRDVLVVVSKLKHYIQECSGMNTADAVKDILSDYLRARCEAAIRKASQDGRKTVLERDFR